MPVPLLHSPCRRRRPVRMLATVLLTLALGPAVAEAAVPVLPSPGTADRDGSIGEKGAILERIRVYRQRHGQRGKLAAADMLARARWGYRRWLDAVHLVQRKGVQGQGWVNLGPIDGAGRMIAAAPHPTLDGTLLAGAAGGGLWRTSDSGATWQPLTDGISDLSVGAVAYAPSDPDVVYLGTGEGGLAVDFIPGIGLLRSDDGGETWFLPRTAGDIPAEQFFALSVHPADPDELLAATERGLLRSDDGGTSWEVLIRPTGLYGVTEVLRSPSDPDLLYTAPWCRQACPVGIARVMRSSDGGVTWTAAAQGLPDASAEAGDLNRAALAIAPSNPDVLYAALNTGSFTDEGWPEARIYRSQDGGASWTVTADPGPYLGQQGWYDNAISVRPDDPNVVVAAGVYYVVSSDGGATWKTLDPTNGSFGTGMGTATIPHVDGHDLEWQGSTLWLACDGGMWRSTDDGDTWSGRNAGLVTRQYYGMALDPINRERVLGGTQDNATNLRRDAGDDTWEVVIGGDGFECAINPLLPDLMYGTVQYGLVFRNASGGAGDWAYASPLTEEDADFITPLTMRQDTPWVLYTGATRVWRTVDAGASWVPLPTAVANGAWSDDTVQAIAVTPADPAVLAVAKASDLYRSRDAGQRWRVIRLSSFINNVELSPFDADLALAAMAGGGSTNRQVMRSSDGGATWQPAGDGLPPFAVQVVRWDPTDPSVVYAGTDIGLYRSTDGGLSWTAFGDGLPAASVHDLRILPDGSMLRVATHGRGVWELEIPQPSNRPPTIQITKPGGELTANVGDLLQARASADDADDDRLTATWYLTDDWRARSEGAGRGHVNATLSRGLPVPGRHTLVARVDDGHGGQAVDSRSIVVRDPADDCSSPWVIPPDAPLPLTIATSTAIGTVGSTDPSPPCVDEPDDPDAGRHGSVWFELTPAESARYAVSTCGSQPDTVLSVWTGERCGSYLPLAGGCNDDDEGAHCQGPRTDSYLEAELEAGKTYRIMVGGWAAEWTGQVRLNVDCLDCTAGPARTWLLAAAANTPGLNKTSWVTDLALYNPSDDAVTASLAFLPEGGDNSAAVESPIAVPAGSAVELADVVRSVFATGGSGAVRIRAGAELLAVSRTYNDAAEGTFGQFIPAITTAQALVPGATARLVGLDQNASFHTNLGLANASAAPANVEVELYDSSGVERATEAVNLEPYGWTQVNQIFARHGLGDVTSGSAVVSNPSGQAAVAVYASVVDDGTGDPVYVTAPQVASVGTPLWVAAAAHVNGVGDSVWRSDLELANLAAFPVTATVELYPTNRDNLATPPPRTTVALPAHASRRLGDVVASRFGFTGSGSLRVTVNGGQVAVTSRTFNLAPGGTYGQFIPALPASSGFATGESAYLLQLRQNASYRTNVGVLNLTAGEIRVKARYFAGDGAPRGTKTYTLAPYSFHQDNGALTGTADNGFAILTGLTEGGSFLAYASVVDRGSDDPVYIPAMRLPQSR